MGKCRNVGALNASESVRGAVFRLYFEPP